MVVASWWWSLLTMGFRLGAAESAVMDLPAEELASWIVRLNTLARLSGQLAVDQRLMGNLGWSAAQVAAYARTIDF